MTKMLVGCLALLALSAGCASAPGPKKVQRVKVVAAEELAAAQSPADKTYVCEPSASRRAGSGMDCQTLQQRELEREAAQEAIRRTSLAPSPRR